MKSSQQPTIGKPANSRLVKKQETSPDAYLGNVYSVENG